MAKLRSKLLLFLALTLAGMILSCAKKGGSRMQPPNNIEPKTDDAAREAGSQMSDSAWQDSSGLTPHERSFIDHFNACASDIAQFAPTEEQLSQYFYIFSNVAKLGDARYFLFAESHTDAASQLWNAGAINGLISEKDVVLFEGEEAGIPIERVESTFIMDLFATRQYELNGNIEHYHADAIDQVKDAFMGTYYKTKKYLSLNKLKLHRVSGSYWDLIQNGAIHLDMYKRNANMVRAMRTISEERRVFVIAGAMHIPHYAFAHTMKFLARHALARYHFLNSSPEASLSTINEAFYRYLLNLPEMDVAQTRVIFEFLKDKNFAVLIPKNLPGAAALEKFFPRT